MSETVTTKPLMRGLLHVLGAVVWCVPAMALARHSTATTWWKPIPFFVGMAAMQVFSACYHAQSLDDTEDRRFWAKADLVGIGLGIIGTFCTMALLILDAPWNTIAVLLGTAWAVTAAAVSMRARKHIQGSPGRRTAIYIGVTFVPAALTLARTFVVRPSAAGWLLAALILFVAGGLVYVLKRPRLRPTVFGFHELFHAITFVGLSAAYCCLWLLVG